jgi:hypothetical protein
MGCISRTRTGLAVRVKYYRYKSWHCRRNEKGKIFILILHPSLIDQPLYLTSFYPVHVICICICILFHFIYPNPSMQKYRICRPILKKGSPSPPPRAVPFLCYVCCVCMIPRLCIVSQSHHRVYQEEKERKRERERQRQTRFPESPSSGLQYYTFIRPRCPDWFSGFRFFCIFLFLGICVIGLPVLQ